MLRRRREHEEQFGRRLYTRADLKDIYGAFQSAAKVRCSIGDYDIDDAADLDAIDLGTIKEITIFADAPDLADRSHAALWVRPRYCMLSAFDDRDTTMLAIASQVRTVLLRLRKQKSLSLHRLGLALTSATAGVAVAVVARTLFPEHLGKDLIPVIFGVAFPIALIAMLSLMMVDKPRYIKFVDPSERTFWSRNKDQLTMYAITTTVGALLGNLDRLWTLVQRLFAT